MLEIRSKSDCSTCTLPASIDDIQYKIQQNTRETPTRIVTNIPKKKFNTNSNAETFEWNVIRDVVHGTENNYFVYIENVAGCKTIGQVEPDAFLI